MTPKQERFVQEYLVDLNATQAAIRAGYSAKTAEVQGPRLLGNVGVAEAIREAMEARAESAGITAERVLEEIAKSAFGDIRAVFDENGHLRLPDDLTDEAAASVASIEVVTKPSGVDADGNRVVEHVHKIKSWDKLKALELLGRHLGMFVDRREITGKGGASVSFVIEN